MKKDKITGVLRIVVPSLLICVAIIGSLSAQVLLDVSRHVETAFTNNEFDDAMDDINGKLRVDNGHCTNDVPCSAWFLRSGDIGTFGINGDGLDDIDTNSKLDEVMAEPERIKVVTSISRCGGGINPSIIGCGICDGFGFIVEEWVQGNVYVHEYGHNVIGCTHRNNCQWNIMSSTSNGMNDAVNEAECISFGGNVLQAGDCNSDDQVDAGDLTALVLEIFDLDGNLPAEVSGGTFAGSSVCDSNEDNLIDAGDLTCTVLTIFNGPGACGN